MPARVRVTPFGGLTAVSSRGLLMGNRGCLHDDVGEVIRETGPYKGWVTCLLAYNGRRRTLRQPGRYTELFFLDEPTALAAGHRPCGTCRRHALRQFQACMAEGLSLGGREKPGTVDLRLHAERLEGRQFRCGWPARIGELPSGVMVTRRAEPSRAWLSWQGHLRLWGPDGYGAIEDGGTPDDIILLTPPSIVAALRAGYEPVVHKTALAPS